MNTWAGSNTVYISKLYNQSSIKTTPLIQPVEANQPTIDISNLKINFDGTNSFMYAETSTELLESGDDTYSYATTALSDDNDNGNIMGFSSASPNMRSQLLFDNSGNLKFVGANNDSSEIPLTENTEYNIVATINNSLSNNVSFWIDNSLNTATSITATSGSGGDPSDLNLDNTNFYVGSLHYDGNNYERFNGYAKSFLVFNKTLDTSNAALFHSKDYYSSNITPYVNEINEESSLVGGYSLYIINNNNKISFNNGSVDLSFNPFKYDSLQSIIVYQNTFSDLSNIKLKFMDEYSNELFDYDLSSGSYDIIGSSSESSIFKIKGKQYDSSIPKLKNIRFSTYNSSHLNLNEVQLYIHDYSNNILADTSNIITQSSTFGSDVSSQVNDSSFNTMARTQKGVGEFIDISLNNLYDVSNIQALVVYTSIPNDTNPTISKIRYQTTSNVKLKVGEFQVWVDNSNIASKTDNSASSIDGIYDLSNLNDSNLYTYVSTNQGIGEYIDISLNNYFNFNDLQGIVTYVDESVGSLTYQKTTKLILFDESNIPVIELSNNIIDDPNLYFSYNASTNTFAGGTLINLSNYTPLIGNAPRTIEAFVSTTNTGPQFIISTGYGGINNYFGLRTQSGKVGLMGYGNDVLSNLNIADGNSHRVVVSYNGLTTVKIFVDNQVETLTLPNGQLNTTSGGNHIGGTTLHVNPSPRDYWNGTIGNVKIYDIYISSLSHLDNYNIYKYKGPSHILNRRKLNHFRLETINYSNIDINEIQMWVDGSNLLHDLSNYTLTYSDQSSTDVSFNNNDVSDSFRIEKGLGKFIDISLNTLQDLSKIESIVYYSSIKNDYNPKISKVRFETIGNVKLEFNEVQIWQDNSNLAINRTITQSTYTSHSSTSKAQDLNLDTSASTLQGVNEFMDIDLSNMRFNDLQSIVTHRDPNASDLSNQKLYRLKIYDDSNVPFIILDNSELSQTSSIHKYKGPSHDNLIQELSKIRLETTEDVQLNVREIQLWINGENVIANRKFQQASFTPLVATKSVTNHNSYNGNLMNWPQSIFGGAMGSNPKTVSGLTGDLAIHNGTYTITYSSGFSFTNNSNREHKIFSASSNQQYGDNNSANANIASNLYSSTLDGNGYPYVGNNSITYYDSNNDPVTVNGEWIAFEFPAYINFTVFHNLSDDYSRAGTFVGVDSTGTNRLIGSYSNSWQNGGWVAENLISNYYVNKFYWIITKKFKTGTGYMHFHEIFFDGNYQISPAQFIYPNNSTITSSIYDTSFISLVPYVPEAGRTVDGSKNNISTEYQFNYNGVSYNVWEEWYKYSAINDIPSTGIAINSRVFSSSPYPHTGNFTHDGTEIPEIVFLTAANTHIARYSILKLDNSGSLYGFQDYNHRIFKDVDKGPNNYRELNSSDVHITDFVFDDSNNIYYITEDNNGIYRLAYTDSGYFDSSGNVGGPPKNGQNATLYYHNNKIYFIKQNYGIYLFDPASSTTSDFLPNSVSGIQSPTSLVIDSNENIFFSDRSYATINVIYKNGTIFGSSVDYSGNPWVVDQIYVLTKSNRLNNDSNYGIFNTNGQHIKEAKVTHPYRLYINNGDLYFGKLILINILLELMVELE